MDKEIKPQENKRKLRLVEKYDNDDYSRYAGPDYSDETFEIGDDDFENSAHTGKPDIELRSRGNWTHPGVSGKTDDGETWVNDEEYKEQKNFVGVGPKNYKRSNDRLYEEVCEALMKDHFVDATNIGVKVESGVVYLSGKVESRKLKKQAELVVENLPGVRDVRNELTIIRDGEDRTGPAAATKKDLGV